MSRLLAPCRRRIARGSAPGCAHAWPVPTRSGAAVGGPCDDDSGPRIGARSWPTLRGARRSEPAQRRRIRPGQRSVYQLTGWRSRSGSRWSRALHRVPSGPPGDATIASSAPRDVATRAVSAPRSTRASACRDGNPGACCRRPRCEAPRRSSASVAAPPSIAAGAVRCGRRRRSGRRESPCPDRSSPEASRSIPHTGEPAAATPSVATNGQRSSPPSVPALVFRLRGAVHVLQPWSSGAPPRYVVILAACVVGPPNRDPRAAPVRRDLRHVVPAVGGSVVVQYCRVLQLRPSSDERAIRTSEVLAGRPVGTRVRPTMLQATCPRRRW